MKKETIKRFAENVRWWNDFFNDLKTLFDRISSVIEQELGYTDKSYYYYNPRDRPHLPTIYYMMLNGQNKPELQLAAILSADEISNRAIVFDEPFILVLLHDYKEHNDPDISWQIVDNHKNVETTKKKGKAISGTIAWGDGVLFEAFQVPLDTFSEYSDQTVKEQITNRIADIISRIRK